MDLLFIGIIAVFFLLSWLLVTLADRLAG